jgi:hypothetical protein
MLVSKNFSLITKDESDISSVVTKDEAKAFLKNVVS